MKSVIESDYRQRTPRSAEANGRAREVMPGGSTRTFGYHAPYPLAFEHGEGPYLFDVDGHRYIDLIYNGLSLIHGHAYPPVVKAVRDAMARGSAWPGLSEEQIAFAELLVGRIAAIERVRFANTGTEAAMLAVKIARAVTRRPLVLKAWAGYHGSYDDLEAGLAGQGEIPGRTLLAHFGDIGSFARVLEERGDEVAAVVLESVVFTGVVTPPPPGFLNEVQQLAKRAGALFVLDDCLMLRLAVGGSAERFGLEPDLVVLGKFVGGGMPVGVVGGNEGLMSCLDPTQEGGIYHGGSFNGNLLGSVAGRVAMEDLTADRIAEMDRHLAALAEALPAMAAESGVPLSVASAGSVLGVYLRPDVPPPTTNVDTPLQRAFHLSCLNNGVYLGPHGECAMATVISSEVVEDLIERFRHAMASVAAEMEELELQEQLA